MKARSPAVTVKPEPAGAAARATLARSADMPTTAINNNKRMSGGIVPALPRPGTALGRRGAAVRRVRGTPSIWRTLHPRGLQNTCGATLAAVRQGPVPEVWGFGQGRGG